MSYIPSLNQIGRKLTKLGHFEIFQKNRDLAGQAGRSKNGRSHLKRSGVQRLINGPHTKCEPIRMIIDQVSPS